MDKFCLKRSDFEDGVRDHFRKLRGDKKLFDVTLATDDGQHIRAHKVILSAGSQFFSNVFLNCDYPNMLIYLRGMMATEVEHVTEFMYNGEVFISQEELSQFLEIGKELQVKGLLCDSQGSEINESVSKNESENESVNKNESENETVNKNESENDSNYVIVDEKNEFY